MSGEVITLLALLGAAVIAVVILPLVGVWSLTRDTGVPKPPGYRVRQVIGFAIVAAGVWIMFLNVSAQYDGIDVACGTSTGLRFHSTSICCLSS